MLIQNQLVPVILARNSPVRTSFPVVQKAIWIPAEKKVESSVKKKISGLCQYFQLGS